ncbi:MAG: OmpA family protein [Prevotella sp.]|nr:OmpA family protein [Prevotella sp.]
MKNLKIATMGLCLAMLVSCSTNTGSGSLIGAGGGAVLGGVLGAVIGKDAKGAAIGAAIGGAVGAGTGALIGKHMDKVKAKAAAEMENAKVEEVTDANGLKAVKVTFDSGLLFATSSATLASKSKNDLNDFATLLKNDADLAVDVQGYTDNQGWKNSTAEQSAQKNLNLSQQRAESVKNYLTSQGVSYNQFKNVTGYGEQNPVADNSTKAGQQANRRVEVYLYASEKMIEKANNGELN